MTEPDGTAKRASSTDRFDATPLRRKIIGQSLGTNQHSGAKMFRAKRSAWRHWSHRAIGQSDDNGCTVHFDESANGTNRQVKITVRNNFAQTFGSQCPNTDFWRNRGDNYLTKFSRLA